MQNGIPTPTSPIPITNIGDKGSVDVNIYGKNLVPLEYRESITTMREITLEHPLPVGRYIASYNSADRTPTNGRFLLGIGFSSADSNNKYITISTSTKTERLVVEYPITRFLIYADNGYQESKDKTTVFEGFMIRADGTDAIYEPYKPIQSLTINTPNGLNGIKVARNGNYIDSKGQHWNTDEIDFANGKVIKRVDKLVIDGTNIKFIEVVGKYWNLPEKCCKGVNNSESISNFTKLFRFNIAYEFAFFSKQEMLSYFATVDELNAYCVQKYNEGNPIVVYYCINPIEHPLSETEIAQFKKLHTNSPTTIVTNDCNADMGIEYTADTKNYVDKEIAELKKAIVAKGV